jgi:hypothetical protein
MRPTAHYYVFLLPVALTHLFGSSALAFVTPALSPPRRRMYSTSRNPHVALCASARRESDDIAASSTAMIDAAQDLTADQVG